MTTAAATGETTIRKEGRWLIALGALSLVLGVLGLFMTFALTVVSTVWFGALLAIVGAAQIAFGFSEAQSRWLNLLLGLIYLAAGVIMLVNPVRAAVSLTFLIGVVIAALGIARIVWSFWFPGFARKLLGVLGGLISLALAWIILSGWPWTGLWVLGLFVAVDLIVYGFTLIGVGWRRRS